MKKDREEVLLKYCISVLRGRLKGEKSSNDISGIAQNLTRKEIVELLNSIEGINVPKAPQLAMMENQELVELITNEMHIVAYCTRKWSVVPIPKKPEPHKGAGTSNKGKSS